MPFAPGQSGNPSGRPRGAAGLARYIGERTDNGRELVDRLLEIMRGEKTPPREVAAAVMALLDRFAGKPLQQSEVAAIARIEHAPALPAGWDAMPLEQRRAHLDDLERGAIAVPAMLALPSGGDAADE